MDGTILFAKYAFAPNRLKYCGPNEHRTIFDYVISQKTDLGLIELLEQFEGAFPYLKLIAEANDIANPFDARVVEAYWLGNNLLAKVETKSLYENVKIRFKKGITNKDWRWLVDRLQMSPQPNHSFHVFEIYRRFGLIRSGQLINVLETMDNCRISWGKIAAIKKNNYEVLSPRLFFGDRKIMLAEPEKKKIIARLLDKSFTEDAKIGDWISLHWNWACDKISENKKNNLEHYTKKYLNLLNLTI